MLRQCILTDSTAQFTQINFPGHELVYVIPLEVVPVVQSTDHFLVNTSPRKRLTAPDESAFSRFYIELSHQYDTILTITLSSCLSPTHRLAQQAAARFNDHATIQVVDSQSTAVGLGLLVQAAAGKISEGVSPVDVERLVRISIPHIYMLFCIPELTYLSQGGYLSYPQAVIGEMLGLLPVFHFEEGHLIPLEKVRTQRHLLESFQEFLDEFNDPQHVALIRASGHNTNRTRPLREYVTGNFPQTLFSEHAIGPYLSALFGPESLGLVIMERI